MPNPRSSARSLLFGSLFALTACREGLNERCQVDSDCKPNLICVIPAGGNLQEGGTCQPVATGTDGGATLDLKGADLAGADLSQQDLVGRD